MHKYISTIIYNEKSFKALVVAAEDLSILNDAKFLPFIIKLDSELRKSGKNKEVYDILHAHGVEKYLIDGNKILMSKEEAAEKFDALVACNNDLWKPHENSKLAKGVYALGLAEGHGLVLRNRKYLDNQIPDCTLYAGCQNDDCFGEFHQNPNGKKVIVAGKPYKAISFEGYQDPQNPIEWTDKGIEFFKIDNLVDTSREVI